MPLVGDLDGTLIKSDLLVESAFAYIGQDLARTGRLVAAVVHGKAALKRQIAATVDVDVTHLLYDDRVIALIQQARTAGRPPYLASASNQRYVKNVALGFRAASRRPWVHGLALRQPLIHLSQICRARRPWRSAIRMKDLGPKFRRDAPAVEDPRATRHAGPDAGTARLFVWRRGRVRPASLGPLVLQEPELPATPAEVPADPPPDTPPDNPSDRAAWIARQLEADCFHFARPGKGLRRG